MNCPNCKSHQLSEGMVKGIVIEYCSKCKGVYYDRSELQKIIESQNATVQMTARPVREEEAIILGEHQIKNCPKDGERMRLIEYPIGTEIYLDECPTCKGIWTDGGETQKITQYISKKTEEDNRGRRKLEKEGQDWGFLEGIVEFLGTFALFAIFEDV